MASIDDTTSNSWRLRGLLASAACTQRVIIQKQSTSAMMALIDVATSNLWCLCGLMASAACMQRFIIKNNQPVRRWHQLTMQQVICGACRGDATASEQCDVCLNKKEYAVPPANCNGGTLWRRKCPWHASKKL